MDLFIHNEELVLVLILELIAYRSITAKTGRARRIKEKQTWFIGYGKYKRKYAKWKDQLTHKNVVPFQKNE